MSVKRYPRGHRRPRPHDWAVREACVFCHQYIVGNGHYLVNGGECDPQLLSDDEAENVRLLRDDPKEYGRRLAYTAFDAWVTAHSEP